MPQTASVDEIAKSNTGLIEKSHVNQPNRLK